MSSDVLARLVRYWESKRGGGDLPHVRSVDPLEMGASLIPHVILVDIERGDDQEPRFRFRLVGTFVVTTLGRDNTGKYFEEYYAAERLEVMMRGVRYVMQNRSPMRSTGNAEFADRGWLELEFVALPLAGADGTVSRIMMGVDSRPREPV